MARKSLLSARWLESSSGIIGKSKSPADKMPVKFEAVRKFALTLDGVEEGTSYGATAFKVRGALFARLKEDGETLVVRMGFDERDEMTAAAPETYFVTEHYLNYKWILVRMAKIEPDAMRDLLRGAWRLAGSDKSSAKKRQSRDSTGAKRRM